jgi:peptide/nickel transport system ATP-binding protein
MQHERPMLRLDAVSKTYAAASMLPALFGGNARKSPPAVDNVSFDIPRGETFGLVGESGSGKSTLARIVTGLVAPTAGAVWFDGVNLTGLRTRAQWLPFRRRIQMIFQDPGSSLDPRWKVRDIIAEPIRTHRLRASGAMTERRVDEVLSLVGLSHRDGPRYPHEFSGGQRQRISIARALAAEAEFIVCDEPTSALDVSIQAQILNILVDLQRELGLTYLFISHNLPVISFVSHRIGVMYAGRLVECGPARDVLENPAHPYTRALLETALHPDADAPHARVEEGAPPGWINGCAFRNRCVVASAECAQSSPEATNIGVRSAACHRPYARDPVSAAA